MLNADTQETFKTTVIRLIEEYILEKITQLDPNTVTTETGQVKSPCKCQAFFAFIRKSESLSFLERSLKIPDEFWQSKYQWLQEARELANNEEELQELLNHEIKPYICLDPHINPNSSLVINKTTPLSNKLYCSQNETDFSNNDFNKLCVNKDYITNLCAINTATELLQKIYFFNINLSTIESIFGVPSKPDTFAESQLAEITGLPTPVPFRAGVESNYRVDKWKRDSNNQGVFETSCQTNPKNRVEVFIAGENNDILALEAALQVIDLMGIEAAKIQLVFAAHVFNQSNLFQPYFTLKGTDIIQQIGWDKKHRLTVADKLSQIASIAFHLGKMLMQCTWVEGKPKGNKVDASVSISPLWVIEVDFRGQMNIFTGKVDNPVEVYIAVRPGPWAEKWLNKMGAKAGIALYQFGWLAAEILKINPYHDELALKLAIHLTMASRIKMRDKNQYEHKVGSLLEAVELEARINAARQLKGEAYNLKQRWDNALKLLTSMGWRVIFDDSTYPDWLRPASLAKKPSGWKKEKIIDRLWRAKLAIMPPEPIPALLATKTKLSPKQLKPAAPKPVLMTATQLREARKAKGWSQAKLAGWLGVSQSLVTKLERGDRPMSPQLDTKLRKVLDIQN
ncbi:MAG: helix-turn-helix transcriptional regulator [Oscillatoriaceae cyanobacterium Prado104]|jgi:DNA-binding transcriptional regulator YiaG|nr:helix-turn-helix transcriptional regulator [Oscillatoriaceae cyanobacterium Prado104]